MCILSQPEKVFCLMLPHLKSVISTFLIMWFRFSVIFLAFWQLNLFYIEKCFKVLCCVLISGCSVRSFALQKSVAVLIGCIDMNNWYFFIVNFRHKHHEVPFLVFFLFSFKCFLVLHHDRYQYCYSCFLVCLPFMSFLALLNAIILFLLCAYCCMLSY